MVVDQVSTHRSEDIDDEVPSLFPVMLENGALKRREGVVARRPAIGGLIHPTGDFSSHRKKKIVTRRHSWQR